MTTTPVREAITPAAAQAAGDERTASPRRPRWHLPAAVLAYLVYALVITRPVGWNLGEMIFGSGGDDNWGQLTAMREWKEHGTFPFAPGVNRDLAFPEGLEVPYAINLVTWPSTLVLWLLTVAFGAVAALQIFVIGGYVANGTAMFLLARRITGHPGAAFIAGLGFAIFPFAAVKGQIHQHYLHGWVFVLLAWRLMEVSARPTLRNGLLAGLAAVLCVSWTPYFLLFGGVLILAIVLVELPRALRAGRLWPVVRSYAVTAGVLVGALAVYVLVARGAPGPGTVARPISEAYAYSSRIPELLLPDARNLIFGDLTRDYLFSHAHGSGYGEFNGYLGWSLLLLALVAIVALLRRRLAGEAKRWVLPAFSVALIATLFAFPPSAQLGDVRLYFPAWVVFEVTTTFRAFARIIPVIEVGVCLLAAIGLAHLLRRWRPGAPAALAIVGALTVIVPLDLHAEPTQRNAIVDGACPPIYDVLNQQKRPGAVVEYPLLPAAVPKYDAGLFQSCHDRPIVNGFYMSTAAEGRALDLSRIDDPRVASRLALLGVRYVIVDEANFGRPDVPTTPRPAKGFRFIHRVNDRALHEVVARPARTFVSAGEGWTVYEGGPGSEQHWMQTPEATIEVRARCRVCRGTLKMELSSFAKPRRLVVRMPGGRVLFDRTVGRELAPVDIPLSFRGPAVDLELSQSPEPQSIRLTTGQPDDRIVGILWANPTFELTD